jgi:hypothetical protein
MDKNQVCRELIKVANELDKSGDYELANELTKTAAEIANERVAFLGKNIFRSLMGGRSQGNYVQMAYQTGNQALYQKATALQQKEMGLNQEKKALIQELFAARKNPQSAQAQPTVQQPAQPVAPAVQQPAQPAA